MDDFVRNKLVEWGLSELVEKFKDEQIDAESLRVLDDREIDNLIPKAGPRVKFKNNLKLLKEEQNSNQETVNSVQQCEQEHEEAADVVQVLPSTSDTGKRKSDVQSNPSRLQSPAKQQRLSMPGFEESIILSDVKNTMTFVHARLNDQDKLSAFLKKKISDLETDKRELVGVFGKTGAGKSSLINAIIKEKNLLPSGSVNACTSVMTKVEANTRSSKYEAEIEFITKEEWKDELWSFRQFLDNNENQEKEDDDDYRDAVEKLSALYREEWKEKSSENLMENKYFKEIPEFLQSRRKILRCESANELSAKFVKYTRSESKQEEGNEGKKWFWPLVKCVTVRVPNKSLLQHVTLVDLPGNGDCNKSRDQMWKGIVGDCSTVWIVTDINRAAAEKEAWEILESVSSLIGNGGECQQIHFICTKSDLLDDSDDLSRAHIHDRIVIRNLQAKDGVRKEFNKRTKIKKHFTDDSFKVFTVSSKEFLKGKHLSPEETEITKLQGFLQELNDCHSETVNYVSGAYGILSLIQGANSRGVDDKKGEVCEELERNMILQLANINKEMEDTYTAFEKCLNDGVEKSKRSYGEKLKNFLYHRKKGGAFHGVLKCVVENGGVHKPKKGTLINLNMMLASCLTDSIDEEFRKTFPNDSECGAFNGVIKTFSLNTDSLIEKYKNAELQLRFLKTEEKKIKAKLNRIIREQKKRVYSSLTETIENIMEEGYKKAAEFRGEGMLYNMRETIKNHVHSKKDMFEQAKNTMLEKLHSLMRDILETLEETMKESFELSFKTDGSSLPDVSTELDMVKKRYHQLADEEINAQSLYYLDDREIDNLITKAGPRVIFKNNLKRLKGKQEHAEAAGLVQEEQNSNQEPIVFFQQCEQEHEEAADVVQVLPSTSSKGKRKSDLQAESLKCSPAAKRRCDSDTRILSEVKGIMKQIKDHINDKEELGAFIKNKISDLEINKRELVGVFGRTGAGKSSLINAIIDEKNLLPTGSISACTSVVIKVEANTRSLKYEAEIEFIKKEEWHDELWSLKTYKKGDDDYRDMVKKLSALYGEEWRDKSPENLIEPKYFKNIPEFLASKRKSLNCDTAQELSQKLRIYTKGGPKQEDGYTAPQWFWPLVKSVTVRVPHNELLQHVTLVDLPGNGDRNKSRNEMWKQIVVDCSTVWIVAEITRAASEVEAWEILKSAHGLIGNGGQCQQIHFICTKSDPADDRVPKNKEAKEEVMNEFQELSEQFSDKGFKVFTVSADEFLKRKRVKEDDNEIPKLQDFLQNLNDCHSETVNYVNGAYGILSLIEGARCSKAGVGKADDVCKVLEKNMREQLDQVKRAVDEAMKDFEQCLTEGVKNSKTSEEKLKFFLDRDQEPSFFKTLEAVVWKYGIHQTKKGEQINLNTVLASCLTDSIDEEFRKTFPNDVKGGSFNGVISRFSLDTKSLIQKYQDVKLQLIFLQTEEDKIKAKLNKIILKGKKIIYNSLTETIEKNMKKCYEDARKISGTDALKKMRKTIETHVSSNRNMYEDAKKTMMKKMNILMTIICKELEETMDHSIKHSLKASALSESLPDVSEHLETVQQHYSEVKRSQEGEMTSQ